MSDLMSDIAHGAEKRGSMQRLLEVITIYFSGEKPKSWHLGQVDGTREELKESIEQVHRNYLPSEYFNAETEKMTEKLIEDLEDGVKETWAYFMCWSFLHGPYGDIPFQRMKPASPFADSEVWVIIRHSTVSIPHVFSRNSLRESIKEYFNNKDNVKSGVYLFDFDSDEKLQVKEENVYFANC